MSKLLDCDHLISSLLQHSKTTVLQFSFCLYLFLWFDRHNCFFRANLSANGTTGAQIRIDVNLFTFGIKSRAGQLINAIPVVFTFFADVKRLAPGFSKTLSIQGAGFFRNDELKAGWELAKTALVLQRVPLELITSMQGEKQPKLYWYCQ